MSNFCSGRPPNPGRIAQGTSSTTALNGSTDPFQTVERKAERLAGRVQRSANTGKDTQESVKRSGRE
jgi:hypothetical protein